MNPVRIAMWSGPRNISTAMMRAFGNRRDCAVSDEPFYAAYLTATGLIHPLRDEVIRSQPTEWARVAEAMLGPSPEGKPVWYQKHMTHHMAPGLYDSVEQSTGFASPKPEPSFEDLPDRLKKIAEKARPLYETLAAHRLRAA